ncbi:hypothetical protein EGR_09078 [Echinococcus granulosus]|uniref:Uncharacterized protein n=2 Tax=Echinococcus granulosus TaxID=6210 RepID=W6U4M7_ECHGR|nr:hypothetical protein EGR_09078 [Echinococcus granulosus]EUB56088.1 hypothetical protein EGR_09078 [Echinococcus granulosus]
MQPRGGMNSHGGHGRQYGQQQCFPQQQFQPNNWMATTQFVNRAKQAALQQSGNHQLAALFADSSGRAGGNGGGGGPISSDGFMRPPMPGVRMGMGPPPQQQGGSGKVNCHCPTCIGGNPFQGPRPLVGPQNEPQQPRGGVMTFTSQLTGLPIPEHPSGLFPAVDFVMVPATGNGFDGGWDCSCGQSAVPTFISEHQQQIPPPPPPPPMQHQPQQQQFGWNGPMDNGSGRCYCGGTGMQMNSLF